MYRGGFAGRGHADRTKLTWHTRFTRSMTVCPYSPSVLAPDVQRKR